MNIEFSRHSRKIKLRVFHRLILVCASAFVSSSACASQLDEGSTKLAYCTDVLAYGINWALLNNNEGMAKVLIMHYARGNAALFTKHYHNGRVPGKIISQFKSIGRNAKPYLDANPDKLLTTIDACVDIVNQEARIQSRRGVIMWGKDWNGFVEHIASLIRKRYGIGF